jgi:sugar lactone lactonase YvrE
MYSSILELIRGGKGSARLLEYDPSTDQVHVFACYLIFANGLSVMDADETALLVAETFGISIHKYHLQGPLEGTMEVIVPGKPLPGYLDDVDCIWSSSNGKTKKKNICYAVMPSLIIPTHKKLKCLPTILAPCFARSF